MPFFAENCESENLPKEIALLWPVAHVGQTMPSESPLDKPETAQFAWSRYKRLMKLMVAITVTVVAIALALLYYANGPVSIHFYVATGLGMGLSMMLASALMGLTFLSNGTGHDASVSDNPPDKRG